MRALQPKPEGYVERERQPREGGNRGPRREGGNRDRGDRGPRRDRGDRGPRREEKKD